MPPLFTMRMGGGLLVFAACKDEAGNYFPDYSVFSMPLMDERQVLSEWPELSERFAVKGHIPAADVEVDVAGKSMRVKTMGLEQFALE